MHPRLAGGRLIFVVSSAQTAVISSPLGSPSNYNLHAICCRALFRQTTFVTTKNELSELCVIFDTTRYNTAGIEGLWQTNAHSTPIGTLSANNGANVRTRITICSSRPFLTAKSPFHNKMQTGPNRDRQSWYTLHRQPIPPRGQKSGALTLCLNSSNPSRCSRSCLSFAVRKARSTFFSCEVSSFAVCSMALRHDMATNGRHLDISNCRRVSRKTRNEAYSRTRAS